jgi:arylsulfatase A-like enzyme
MDQNIGRLINDLKANGEYENTLIVFLSDNGACAETVNVKLLHDPSKKIGERGSYSTVGEAWANASNTPFRLYKHHTHEGGINTPCIIHWPAKIKPGKGFKEGVGHVIDLMPTAVELAGADVSGLAGKSLSYLWSGKKNPERTYCWEHEGNKAIRKGRWKLVKEQKDQQWELYDLQSDPVEMKDLSSQEPAKVQELLNEYLKWEKEMGVKEFKGKPYGMGG